VTLNVRQEQKFDPAWFYPQAELFRAPLEIEIGTSNSTRIERVMVEPKEEQTFTFAVDSQPLLVNFDYGSTLIKELKFDKTPEELIYQLTRDEDVTGRLWALGQLTEKLNGKVVPQEEKQRIAAAIGATLNNDRYWGVRVDAATALAGEHGTAARTALLAAVKDKDARVRTSAVNALAKSKDPKLASLYLQLLNDESYATVRAAALALGETKSPVAYDALAKLLEVSSWRDQIRASALTGLANLGDLRALDAGIRYAAGGNNPQVRAAALALLGEVGKNDPRTFALVSEALLRAISTNNTAITNAASETLIKLGDPRAVQVFEQAVKGANSPQIQGLIKQFLQRLTKSSKQ
jgi:aminopeptidase N